MNDKIIKKLQELGFRDYPSYNAVRGFNYGSDFVELREGNRWIYIEYMGYNENTMMGKYDSHSFETVDELMELIKKFHSNLIK